MFYLTEDLVNAIKLSSFVPTGQSTFTDPDDFISLANEELQTKLVPHIVKVRQNFFAKHETTPLVSLINHYPVPERSIGNTLVDLFYLPSTSDYSNKRPIPQIDIHDQQMFQSNSSSEVSKHFLEGDEVICVPTPVNPTGYLMFYYLRKPSKIVPTSSCAKITSISSGGGTTTFTVNTDLTASLAVASVVDFVAAKSPFLCRNIDVAITAITSTTIAVATTDVSDEASRVEPKVGGYICPAQQSCIPQVPDVFHPILSEMVVCRALRSLGDLNKLNAAKGELVEKLKDAWSLVENRTESEVAVIFDQNSLLNQVNAWTAFPYATIR